MAKPLIHLNCLASSFDPTNNKVLDVSGNGNDFTNVGAVKLSTKGYSFDGGDYLDGGNNFNIGTGNFSVCCTVKQNNLTSTIQSIVGKSFGGDKVGRWALYTAAITGYLTAILETAAGTPSIYDSLAFPLGVWNTICFSINRTDKASLYLNGRLLASSLISPAGSENLITTDPCRIGCYNDVSGNPILFLNGSIADVRFFNKAFTQIEANDYHNRMMSSINNI